jgi:hypothetical protein
MLMFWFVTIVLIVTMCAGAIGFGVGLKLLKFGEDAARQERTLRVVIVSFMEILAGGMALAAIAARVVDPLIALAVVLITCLITLLGFRIRRGK